MSTDLIPFNFDKAEIRVLMIEAAPKFVAKDVATALEYSDATISNIEKTIGHVPEEWKGRYPIPTLGGLQEMWCLTEEGLYFFVARSDKPKALPFQKWLAGEVLPAIRKHGFYGKPQNRNKLMELSAKLIKQLDATTDQVGKNLLRQHVKEINQQLGNKVPDSYGEINQPGDQVEGWIEAISAILDELEAGRFTLPFAVQKQDGEMCLIIRAKDIMVHLRKSAYWASLALKSDRVLKRQLIQARVLQRDRIDLTLNGERVCHLLAIRLSSLEKFGIETSELIETQARKAVGHE